MKAVKLFFVVFLSCGLLVEFAILYYFLVFLPTKFPSRPPQRYLLEVPEEEIPRFAYWQDDYQELKEAFQREEGFLLQKIANREKISFGETKLAASLVKESADLLLQTLQEVRSEEELNRLIRKRFIIYQAVGEKGEGKVLFTGYYSPIYEGSLEKQGPFEYPLYLIPKDLKIANLGEFDPALEGERAFSKAGNIKRKGRLYFLVKR